MTGSALHKAGALALLAVILLISPASAKLMVPQDFTGVTVVLSGGWELPGLTVRWSDPDGGLYVVRADGARRLYKPQEMAGLKDNQGRDITRDVMPDWAVQRLAITPGGLPPVEPRQQEPVHQWYQEAGGQPSQQWDDSGPNQMAPSNDWIFLLGVEAGWGKPRDNDFLNSDGGLGVGVRTRLQLGGALYLAGGYSWQSLPAGRYPMVRQADSDHGVPDLPMMQEGQLKGFWAGLSLLSPGEAADDARFYIEGGVGRYEVENLLVMSADEYFLGYTGGAGFLIPLGTAAALDLGVRATHVVNLDLGYGDDRHTLVAFRAGLSILSR